MHWFISDSVFAAPQESQKLSRSIVLYVYRSRESLVLNDAVNEGAFTQDRFVVAQRPKSIICLPVMNQGKLVAILYLENNLTTGAFTPDRLEALNLIVSQIAVSFENARLYQSIERKVDERTRELSEKTELLNMANIKMQMEIEQRKLLEDELRKLASTDFLTGLFTRRKLFELGEREINRAKRAGAPLSLLIMDIDHFKSVNDTYGHAIGDEVLKDFAKVCREAFRSTDIVGRFGGEEFVTIMPDTHIPTANEVAERLRQNIEKRQFPVAGKILSYTVSIGLAGLNVDENSIDPLIARGDEALYKAKKTGRNKVVIAEGG